MRFCPPEALFLVGTLVRARPRGSDMPQQGRIAQIKVVGGPDSPKSQLFNIRFFGTTGSTEAREAKQTSWYRYDDAPAGDLYLSVLYALHSEGKDLYSPYSEL